MKCLFFTSILIPFAMQADPLQIPKTIYNVSSATLINKTQLNLQQSHRFERVRDRMKEETSNDQIKTAMHVDLQDSKLTASAGEAIQVGEFRNKQVENPTSIYIAPFGSIGGFETVEYQLGHYFNTIGGLIGADYAFSRAGFGFQAGYVNFDGDSNKWGDNDQNEVFAYLYGTFLPTPCKKFYVDLSIGGGYNWFELNRKIADTTITGNPHGWNVDAYLETGYDFWYQKMRFTPKLALQYVYLWISEYQEKKEGPLSFNVSSRSNDSLRSWLGASIGGETQIFSTKFIPSLRAFWVYEFTDLDQKIEAVSPLVGSTQLKVYGHQRNSGVVGAEFVFQGKHWSFTFDYDFFWNQLLYSNMFYGEIGYNF